MKQTKQVMLGFKIIGAKIATVHMDSGGENMRGIKIFRLVKDPTDQRSWLHKYYCTFSNPVDPSRRVPVALCSTHNGKVGINKLRTSSNQAEDSSDSKTICAIYFLKKGVCFTWRTIERCFDRDSKKGVQETPINNESAYPDRRNKMSNF